jgi:hypothetical protein
MWRNNKDENERKKKMALKINNGEIFNGGVMSIMKYQHQYLSNNENNGINNESVINNSNENQCVINNEIMKA